jgi:hypothetical protein
MSIISHYNENENRFSSTVDNFLKENRIGFLLKQSNFYKEKGISCYAVFKFLFTLVFSGKNLYRILESQNSNLPFAKDVIYRFLNSIYYNWQKFLMLLASSIIRSKLVGLTSDNRVNVLIIDDSIYSRNRSKVVELLARVRDHVAQKYVKGFRLLTLGWSDGNTFIPLGFNLLSAQTSENRLQPMNSEIDKRSIGYKRRISSLAKETDAMIDLLKQAVENNIPAKYVLFDSWFTYPSILLKILGLNLHIIAMVKGMKKIYYSFQGKRMSLQSIYSCVRKKRGKAKILSSVVVGIGTDNDGNEVLAKIVFVRDRNRSRNWLAIISTDTTLSDEEIIRIYGKRWDIEIFFKICKSYLNLAKEFQGRSYDSIVAHTTIVFARYIMLAVENRNNKDLRTIGGLFYYFCDELQDIKFIEALQLLIDALKTALREKLVLSKEAISEFLDYFMSCLPTFLKEKLALCSCES